MLNAFNIDHSTFLVPSPSHMQFLPPRPMHPLQFLLLLLLHGSQQRLGIGIAVLLPLIGRGLCLLLLGLRRRSLLLLPRSRLLLLLLHLSDDGDLQIALRRLVLWLHLQRLSEI